MKLLLLYAASTFLVVSINAAILPETQHITNDLDRQIVELYRARDVKDSLNAAAEYFKAPQASKQNLKTESKERLAAAAEYFKAPDANELRINALTLAQQRLAAAAEYLKAPEFAEHLSGTKVDSVRAAAAEYFKAPESPRHNTRIDRTAESLAAAAEYLKAPELSEHLSGTKMENARAAAAEYFSAPESLRHNTRIYRTIESKAADAKNFRKSDYYSRRDIAKRYFVAVRSPMSRPTEKAHRGRFVRLG